MCYLYSDQINKVLQFGLIGKPLKHSRSAILFAERFVHLGIQAKYHLYELDFIEELVTLIENTPNLIGLNVTSPYKELVLPYCDSLSSEVQAVGATNTLLIKRSNEKIKIEAYNTDVAGFGLSLDQYYNNSNRHYPLLALILGTGGAAKAVKYALEIRHIEAIMVSRNPLDGAVGYENLEEFLPHAKLIINATPVGYRMNELPKIPYALLSNEHLCYDLIYNPDCTQFLFQAKRYGAEVINGMRMLELQAEEAWQIWHRHLGY